MRKCEKCEFSHFSHFSHASIYGYCVAQKLDEKLVSSRRGAVAAALICIANSLQQARCDERVLYGFFTGSLGMICVVLIKYYYVYFIATILIFNL